MTTEQAPAEAFPEPPPPVTGERDGAGVGMEARTALLLVSAFATILALAVLALLPVPYALLKPGPALNTLGEYDGQQLITVEGRQTYETAGRLDMTTVTVFGGPSSDVTLWEMVIGWLDASQAVVPQDSVFPPGQSAEEKEEENQAEMVSSQESATAAAMAALDIPVPTVLSIAKVPADAPSSAVLKADDVILAVDGESIEDLTQLREALQEVTPGDDVTLRVGRGSQRLDLEVPTSRSDDGRTRLGVYIDPTFEFPFDVSISIENVGGPSAGMMFALGIIDTITPGPMTGGEHIAGTGTIDADGLVGPIGGIQQKLAGARDAGASWFLTPASNCDEVVGHVPDGLRVVKVATLDEARAAVEAIGTGKGTAGLPTC